MRGFLTILLMVCPLAAFLFTVRLVCACFSSEVSRQLWRYPVRHIVWGCFGFVGTLVCLVALDPAGWPPPSVERRMQRQKVLDRINTAGGWDALRRECITFARTNEIVQWIRRSTNDFLGLPPAIRALQPQEVYYVSPKFLGPRSEEPKIAVVRIKVFGRHATGGHSTPFFGLDIVARPSDEHYTPGPRPAASDHRHINYRKVCDGIYEIY